MNVDDQVCFGRIQTQDYELEELVHTPEAASKHLIDYRVKLLLKEDIVLQPGHEILVKTACTIGNGIANFCLHIKKSENIPITLLSEGYISDLFTGRIVLKLANYTGEKTGLCSGSEMGFLIINSFSLN